MRFQLFKHFLLFIILYLFTGTNLCAQPHVVKSLVEDYDKVKTYYLYESTIRSIMNLKDLAFDLNFNGTVEYLSTSIVETKDISVFKQLKNEIIDRDLELYLQVSNVNLDGLLFDLPGISSKDKTFQRLMVYGEDRSKGQNFFLLAKGKSEITLINIVGNFDLEEISNLIKQVN